MKNFPLTEVKFNVKIKKDIAIILPYFNDTYGEKLYKAAIKAFTEAGIKERTIKLFRVPGALEIPFLAQELALTKKFSIILAFGVIIKGRTAHFDIVNNETSRGIMEISLKYRIPILNGIIPASNIDDVKKRTCLRNLKENKGYLLGKSALQLLGQINNFK